MPDTSKQHQVYQLIFLAAAVCLNLPPVVLGIMGCLEWCAYFGSWLAANAAFSTMNCVAALYIFKEMRKLEAEEDETSPAARNAPNSTQQSPIDHSSPVVTEQGSAQVDNTLQQLQDSEQTQQEQQRKCCLCFVHTSHSKHFRHLIRYDGYVSTYCIFVIFWLFWLSDGAERINHMGKADTEDLENCSGFHEDYVLYSFSMGYAYLVIVVASLAMLHLPERKARGSEGKVVIDA